VTAAPDDRPDAAVVAAIDVADPVVGALLDAVPDGVVVVGAAGRIVLANRRAEELFGYPPRDLVGRLVEELVPERFRGGHAGDRAAYLHAPRPRPMGIGPDLHAVRADGTERSVEISLSPLATDDGPLVIASIRDITERIDAEAHSRRVQRSLDAIRDGVFMFDPTTLRFIYVNQGAIEQVGWSRRELLEMTPVELLPEFGETGLRELIQPLVEHRLGSRSLTTVHRRRDGSDVPVEVVVQCPDQGAGHVPVVVALVRDVSERLESEARLRSAHQELELLEDRERIARDLHDTVIQRLFATGMSIQATAVRAADIDVSARLQDWVDELDTTIREIRTAIFGLQAHAAWGQGLRGEALRVAREAAPTLGFEPRVRFDGPVDTVVTDAVAAELLPTLREALANVARHAGATDVEVGVRAGAGRLVLVVADDGIGPSTDTGGGDPLTGRGVRNMAARAEALGGWFELRRGPVRGTVIEWDVPLDALGSADPDTGSAPPDPHRG